MRLGIDFMDPIVGKKFIKISFSLSLGGGGEFCPLYFDPKFRPRLNLSIYLINRRLLIFRWLRIGTRQHNLILILS